MTIPDAHDAALLELRTDAELLERVTHLVTHAHRRQLWLMFLDENDRQIPLLTEFEIPKRPRAESAEVLTSLLSRLADRTGASRVAVTLERPGSDEVSDDDRRWLRVVAEAGCLAEVGLRGPMLAHADGVRWIGSEDL
jgi:hypothetical protein